ncbi:O-antigen export system permease protein RfbD [Methanosarcina siciliae T4/M]|uniref:O-antigen export system permease protein RfbD n=2 Tax=Methanosarcina siciliae TaxID=38027 RepID=A0A0E3PFM2_9EURY|nr:ABC transporter permease [Methanosarcina siciliae]AKB29613.1 O-antigen export system permease protein RfbD [Methanosarcina siciliae T4/M]AKB33549.1 O-antigen export system permease protein RfbD [Methanosarcina siciliae HI350]
MYLFEYSELIKNLVISDLKVKYQSSVLGFAWSMLNPLLMMLVLYVVFSNIFRFEQEHFDLYLLIGIIAWRFLANGTMTAMTSIVGKPSLVTKIYIPREILTFSLTMSAFISSILEFAVLIPLLLILGASLSLTILLFPVIHILYFLIVYGISLALASLYVYFRDLNQIWDIVLQVGFYTAPIIYPLSLVPEKYLDYYMLSPITRLMMMYRDVLLYGTIPHIYDFMFVAGFGLAFLAFGSLMFRKLSPRFAEEV